MKISYKPHLDGDGREIYSEFLRIIRSKIGNVETLFEFCAGPAFIGFSLLEDRICKKLVLADIEQEAIECCRKTIKENGLEKTTLVHKSNCLEQIPPQKWDLIVGNPPHFYKKENFGIREDGEPTKEIISMDQDWKIHNGFFRDIGAYMEADSLILLVENGRASSPETFRDMINKGGLNIKEVIKCNLDRPSKHYFMLINKNV